MIHSVFSCAIEQDCHVMKIKETNAPRDQERLDRLLARLLRVETEFLQVYAFSPGTGMLKTAASAIQPFPGSAGSSRLGIVQRLALSQGGVQLQAELLKAPFDFLRRRNDNIQRVSTPPNRFVNRLGHLNVVMIFSRLTAEEILRTSAL